METELLERKPPRRVPRLKLFVPDTLVYNDLETSSWTYTDTDGYVKRKIFSDPQVIEKFKSSTEDNSEIIAIYKVPVKKDGRITENQVEVLAYEGLEQYLFAKRSSQCSIQRFVKSKGPKAFICRSVWRRNKSPYVYILTNLNGFHDNLDETKHNKFIVNTQRKNSFTPMIATSGKQLEETNRYMKNIVSFIENNSGIIFEELVADFIK